MRLFSLPLAAGSLAALRLAAPPPALAAEEGGNLFAGDIGNAIWTLAIFLVVLWVLGKYAWGPLLKGLQDRESFIRESLERAKREREAAEALLREHEERLAQSRSEATAIVEQGRRDAEKVRHELEEHAKREAQHILERARRDIEIATQAAAQDLYRLAGKLAIDIASRVIARELKPQDHERLVAESIAELEAHRH